MNRSSGNVYLVGPMGSGKTSIGRRLAAGLNLEFLDCDHELEAATGASVNLIFDVEGEQGFRERESKMLKSLTSREGVLVATGGGAVARAENREMLTGTGLVVYLQTSVSQQIKRLKRDKSRPLLQTENRREKLTRLAEERNPLYEGVADIVFPAHDRSLDQAARELLKVVREHQKQE